MRRRRLGTLCFVIWVSAAGCGDDARAAGVGTGPGDQDDGGTSHPPEGTDPLRGEAPQWPEAEAEIELPYRGGDVATDFMVSSDLGELDLHVNVDTTASFGDEIDALQASLHDEIVPTLARRVPHVSFGVSRFADFPVRPFGDPDAPDRPYVLLTPVTSDLSRVSTAVARLDNPLGFGGDQAEAGAESLYQIATGEGYVALGTKFIDRWDRHAADGGGELGGVGFRAQALRLVLHVTDALSHAPKDYLEENLSGTHDMAAAASALRAVAARTIGIMSTDCHAPECRGSGRYHDLREELSELAVQTLAVMGPTAGKCPTGIDGELLPTYREVCPLVFDVRSDGTGLASTIVDAVLGLLDRLRFGEVHAEVLADPLQFLQSIEAIAVKQPAGVTQPRRVDRLPADQPDGRDDTFLAVQKRERLGFRITLRNDRIPPMRATQRFRVSVRVLGDGVTLEERTLRVVIPAAPGTPSKPSAEDAGRDAGPDGSRDGSTLDAASSGDDAGP